MFAAQAIGSVFNISYNLIHIQPLLSPAQEESFKTSIGLFNALAYPPLAVIWAVAVFRLRRTIPDTATLAKMQRAVINPPFAPPLYPDLAVGRVRSVKAEGMKKEIQ